MGSCREMSEIKAFLATAKPKTELKYYEGCFLGESMLSHKIGEFIYDESAKGKVYLIQRRSKVNPFYFEYFAVKASPIPARILIPMSTAEFNRAYRLTGRNRHYVYHRQGANPNGQIERTY